MGQEGRELLFYKQEVSRRNGEQSSSGLTGYFYPAGGIFLADSLLALVRDVGCDLDMSGVIPGAEGAECGVLLLL